MTFGKPIDRTRDGPLDPAIWFAEARRLAATLARSDSDENRERLLRRAYYLSRLLPDPLWAIFGCPYTDDVFERVLENEPIASAVEIFVNPRLIVTTITSGGTFAVSLRSPDVAAGGRHVGASPVVGTIGAWLSCIFAVEAKGWEQALSVSTDPLKSPAERHPQSSEH